MGSTGLIQTRTASYNGRDDKAHIFPGRFLGPQYNGRPGHWQRSWEEKKQKQRRGLEETQRKSRHVNVSMNDKARGTEREQKRGKERRESSKDFICSKNLGQKENLSFINS